MIYALYNPYASKGHGYKDALNIRKTFPGRMEFIDVTGINIRTFYQRLRLDDEIILAGGDGTLNRFINAVYDIEKGVKIRYYQSGTGNDFARDVKDEFTGDYVDLNLYMKDLPVVTVKGESHRFLNGIGYGVDGYCCEKSDEIKSHSGRHVNYSILALRGLFFDYKPKNATVIVDGVKQEFTQVLLAPAMHGRFYGGGIKIAPDQNRLNEEGEITLVVVHNLGKLKAMSVFPEIYIGTHIRHKDVVTVLKGRDITVKFDEPSPLQIDGETVHEVTEYRVRCAKVVEEEKNNLFGGSKNDQRTV